jgi:hypothetical protein
MTGGHRGYCAGAAPRPWGGGGRGWRNQYYATGLTGWQRQAQPYAPPANVDESAVDLFARLEGSVAQILERLEGLEAAVKK